MLTKGRVWSLKPLEEQWRSGESGPESIRASTRAMPVAPIDNPYYDHRIRHRRPRAASCAAPGRLASRSTCSAKLLLMLPPGARKATRSDSLSGRARTTGTRLRLTEGSITEVRPHLSGVSGFDAVESFAFSLVSMSASSARRRGSGQSIPAARTISRPWIIMLKVAG